MEYSELNYSGDQINNRLGILGDPSMSPDLNDTTEGKWITLYRISCSEAVSNCNIIFALNFNSEFDANAVILSLKLTTSPFDLQFSCIAGEFNTNSISLNVIKKDNVNEYYIVARIHQWTIDKIFINPISVNFSPGVSIEPANDIHSVSVEIGNKMFGLNYVLPGKIPQIFRVRNGIMECPYYHTSEHILGLGGNVAMLSLREGEYNSNCVLAHHSNLMNIKDGIFQIFNGTSIQTIRATLTCEPEGCIWKWRITSINGSPSTGSSYTIEGIVQCG